jgi:HEAT repeat protein
MTDSELNNLFELALAGEYDEDAPWEAIRALQIVGTRKVFDKAAEWCRSDNALMRARGADILSQIGKTADHTVNSFVEESYEAITGLLKGEKDPIVLAAAITALGHLDKPQAVPLITTFTSDPDPDVRFAVAFTLGCYANEPVSVAHLLRLMRDEEEDVRDWATFGLGIQGDADNEEIRDALVHCLEDSDEDVREEAIAGLGKRKDEHVLPAVMVGLQSPHPTYGVIEAACCMLGLKTEQKGWSGLDYAAALRSKFKMP